MASASLLLLTGCGSEEGSPEQPTATSTSTHEFSGSPAEYNDAMITCLRQLGWQVNETDDGGYGVALNGASDDEYFADQRECRDEVGAEPMADLSQEELRSRYDWRREQYECLIDNGFDVGDPMSYETFVDNYQRTGRAHWDPISMLADNGQAVQNATELCPYSNDEW